MALPLDDVFFADVDAAVTAASDRDMEIMFVLLDSLWCARAPLVDGMQLGGRAKVLRDAAKRDAPSIAC